MQYEAEFTCTVDDAKKSALINLENNKKFMKPTRFFLIFLFVLSILLIILVAYSYSSVSKLGIASLVISILYLPAFKWLVAFIAKQSYKTNVPIRGASLHYTFDEEEFEIKTDKSYSKVTYNALYSIVEDDEMFLLKPSERQMFIVRKDCCSEELISFLRKKAEKINTVKNK